MQRRSRLPALRTASMADYSLSSASAALGWLQKQGMESTREDIIRRHLRQQQELNSLTATMQQRIKRAAELRRTLDSMEAGSAAENSTLGPARQQLRMMRAKLQDFKTKQVQQQAEDRKLAVILRRTESDLLQSVAKLQEIGEFRHGQLQGVMRARRYLLEKSSDCESSKQQLSLLQRAMRDSEFQYSLDLATRQKQIKLLRDLDQRLAEVRQEQSIAEHEFAKERQQKLLDRQAEQLQAAGVDALQRYVGLASKVDSAVKLMQRRGHTHIKTLADIINMFLQTKNQQRLAIKTRQESIVAVKTLSDELKALTAQRDKLRLSVQATQASCAKLLGHGKSNMSSNVSEHEQELALRKVQGRRVMELAVLAVPWLTNVLKRISSVPTWSATSEPSPEVGKVSHMEMRLELASQPGTPAKQSAEASVSCASDVSLHCGVLEGRLTAIIAELKGSDSIDWELYDRSGFQSIGCEAQPLLADANPRVSKDELARRLPTLPDSARRRASSASNPLGFNLPRSLFPMQKIQSFDDHDNATKLQNDDSQVEDLHKGLSLIGGKQDQNQLVEQENLVTASQEVAELYQSFRQATQANLNKGKTRRVSRRQ